MRHLGPVGGATGLGPLGFTIVAGYGLCLLLGYDALAALYIAVALTFSRTIIIVKLRSDKREIDSLHGRIAVGFLIVQDIARRPSCRRCTSPRSRWRSSPPPSRPTWR